MTPTKDQLTSDTEWLADHFAKHGWPGASVGAQAAERILHALSTVDHLRGEVERLNTVASMGLTTLDLLTGWNAANKRAEASEVRCAALVEALEPFARIAPSSFNTPDGSEAEEYVVILKGSYGNPTAFTGSDLAAARQALKAVTPTTSDGDIGEAND